MKIYSVFRTKMVGCANEVEFLAKVYCIREASKVEMIQGLLLQSFFVHKQCSFVISLCASVLPLTSEFDWYFGILIVFHVFLISLKCNKYHVSL